MKVEFKYGSGFSGSDYYLLVDGKRHSICLTIDPREAFKKTREKLQELNIPAPEKIEFEWDGTL